jgi:hypothetical protein
MRLLAATLAVVAAACFGGDEGDGEEAAQAVASAVETSGELARLIAPLQATPDLQGLPPLQAIQAKIDDAATKFRQLVTNDGCLAVTKSPGSLAVTFTGCRFGLVFRLEGALSASVGVDLDGIGRPAVLVLRISSPGVEVIGPVRTRRLAGQLELRHVIALAGPVTADLALAFENDAGVELGLIGHAEWTVDDACATITAGGQITGTRHGTVAIAERDVHACRNTCPDAGSVELAFDRGQLLRWTYTGEGTAAVIGPRGREFEVPLACGE